MTRDADGRGSGKYHSYLEAIARNGGAVEWGFKESFRDYLLGSGGVTTVRLPATLTDAGLARFPIYLADADRQDPTSAVLTVRLGGAVEYTGHGGLLSVSFEQPALVAWANGLSFAVAHPRRPGLLIDIATLTPAGDDRLDCTLTAHGAQLFLDNYPPGATLDPIHIFRSGPPLTESAS